MVCARADFSDFIYGDFKTFLSKLGLELQNKVPSRSEDTGKLLTKFLKVKDFWEVDCTPVVIQHYS